MARGNLVIEVEVGPMLWQAMRVLRRAHEYAELIPDWHAAERRKFIREAKRLVKICENAHETSREASNE